MSTANYLITGIPGSGKTTAGEILAQQGYSTVDGDNYPGLVKWINQDTGLPSEPPTSAMNTEWFTQHKHVWDKEVLNEALEGIAGAAIVYGTASNLHEFFNLFKVIALLKVYDPAIVMSRLNTRDGNDFGKSFEEKDFVLSWYEDCQNNYESNGARVINAKLPKLVVARLVLNAFDNPAIL